MFANLSRTLEDAAGGEVLAEWLAGLRRGGASPPNPGAPAFERAFRRLGLLAAGEDVSESIRGLAARMGESVSRPAPAVMAFFSLFVQGDAGIGLKEICGAVPRCRLCRLTRECRHFSRPGRPAAAGLSPAERLRAGNADALSDAELLALLLDGGNAAGRGEAVSSLFSRYGGLGGVFRADHGEYFGLRGVTPVQARRLAAASALYRRLLAERRESPLMIASARDIHDRYADEIGLTGAGALVIMLDDENRVMRDLRIGESGVDVSRLSPADLLRPALREGARRVALVTVRPSGTDSPSAASADLTRRLRAACDIIGVGLLDHVIVTGDGYFSFAEAGRLGG